MLCIKYWERVLIMLTSSDPSKNAWICTWVHHGCLYSIFMQGQRFCASWHTAVSMVIHGPYFGEDASLFLLGVYIYINICSSSLEHFLLNFKQCSQQTEPAYQHPESPQQRSRVDIDLDCHTPPLATLCALIGRLTEPVAMFRDWAISDRSLNQDKCICTLLLGQFAYWSSCA